MSVTNVRFALLSSALYLSLAIAPANAGISYRPCDAVNRLADIKYDDSLIVSVYRDSNSKLCSFEVFPPPNSDLRSPQNGAALFLRDLSRRGQPTAIEMKQLTDAFVNALIAPIENGKKESSEAKVLIDIAKFKEWSTIQKCALDAVAGRPTVIKRSDFITCGSNEMGGFFIEAAYMSVSVSLTVPMRLS